MKVKIFISKAVECEIDDKFRKLAVPMEKLREANIPASMYAECIAVVEKATGLPWWPDTDTEEDAYQAELTTGAIVAVHSAENGEAMLEA